MPTNTTTITLVILDWSSAQTMPRFRLEIVKLRHGIVRRLSDFGHETQARLPLPAQEAADRGCRNADAFGERRCV